MECNESLPTLRTLSKFGAQRYVLVGYSVALHYVFCKACAPLQDGGRGRALSYGRHFASAVQATARSPSVPPRRFTAPQPGAPAAKAPAMPAAASAAQAPAMPAAASAAPAMPVAASAAKAPAVPVAAAPAAHAPAVPVAASAAKGPAEPVAVAPPAQAPAMPAAASAAKAAAVPVAAAPAPAPAATAESASGGTGAARVWRGGGAGPASSPAKAPSAAEATLWWLGRMSPTLMPLRSRPALRLLRSLGRRLRSGSPGRTLAGPTGHQGPRASGSTKGLHRVC